VTHDELRTTLTAMAVTMEDYTFNDQDVAVWVKEFDQAGGVDNKHSTDVVSPLPPPRVSIRIHPGVKSCMLVRSRFVCLFCLTLLPGRRPPHQPRGVLPGYDELGAGALAYTEPRARGAQPPHLHLR